MRIPDQIFQNNEKLFVAVNTRNTRALEFAYHLWLTCIDQPHSYVVVFEIIYFQIYKSCNRMVTWNIYK